MLIPAFVNPAAGSAKTAIAALRKAGGFDLQLVDPRRLQTAVRQAVARGAPRVLVAGGDGTVATAAAVLAGTDTALAVLPGGTLNHFARDYGIPTDPEAAVLVAATRAIGAVDIGYVNGRPFINTSSVGAYVRFVYLRDRIEPLVGYHLASLLAGIRALASLRRLPIVVDVAGETRVYQAPLLFVGVGERLLTPAGRGARVPGGARQLHLVVPRGRQQARRFTRAYARRGRQLVQPAAAGEFGLDALLADRFRVELPGRREAGMAVDGEICRLAMPLDYRLERDALRVVGLGAAEGLGTAREAATR